MSESKAAEALNLNTQYIGSISIELIRESAINPRKTFTHLEELAASIARQGVMSPVLVRSAGDEGEKVYELICGARRLRAAKMAGLQEIPALMVIPCTDEQLAELQLVENSQRADVHPMEEAEAYEAYVTRVTDSIDPPGEVARRVGKSRAHVLKRLVLLQLPADARKAYRSGAMSYELAVAIARLPDKAAREKAAKRYAHAESSDTSDIDDLNSEYLLSLKAAPFSRTDAKLLPGVPPCGACPKRTGNQTDLFGDVEGPDLCTDGSCYKRKSEAAWKQKAAAARAAGQRVLTVEEAKEVFGAYNDSPRGTEFVSPNGHDHQYTGYQKTWRQVLGDEQPATVLARTPSGKVVELWDASEAKRLARAKLPAPSKAELKEKDKAREERKKAKLEKDAIVVAVSKLLDPGISPVGSDELRPEWLEEHEFLRKLLPVMFKNARGFEFGAEVAKRRGFKGVKPMLEQAQAGELRTLLLEAFLGSIGDWKRPEAIPALAEAFGLKMAECRKEAAAED